MKSALNKTACLFFILLFLVLSYPGNRLSEVNASPQEQPTVKRGHLDLSRWDFKESGSVQLAGEWRFFWKRLIPPKEIEAVSDMENPVWAKLPGDWSRIESIDPELPADGFATYSIIIDFPPRHQIIGIRIRDINTAYRLFINDNPAASAGVVSDNIAHYRPGFKHKTILFTTDSSRIRLTLQVANFSLLMGGPINALELGDAESIFRKSGYRSYLDLLVFGLLVIMAFYHLGLYYQRREDKSTLYFALFCIVIGIRAILTGERTGFNLFFNWPIAFRIDILTIYLSAPFFFMFFKSVFPRYLSARLVRFVQLWAVINILLVVTTPARIYMHVIIPNQILIFLFLASLVYAITLEIYHKNRGAIWAASGLFLVILTIINDVLFSNGIIDTTHLVHFGVISGVQAQSYLLSIRFSDAYAEAEKSSAELKNEMEIRLKAEARLTESEQRFRDMAKFLPIAVAEYDFDLNFLWANIKASEMLGYTKEDLNTGINVKRLLPDEFFETVMSRTASAKKGQAPVPLELSLIRKDGSRIWGEVYPSLIYKANESVGVRTCFVDLTDRREAERKLRQSYDELEAKVAHRTMEFKKAKEVAEKANKLKSEFLANISHELRNPMHQILSYSKYGIEKIDRPKQKLLHYFSQTRNAADRLMTLLNDLLDLSKLESGRMDYNYEPCRINEVIQEAVADFKQAILNKNIQVDIDMVKEATDARWDAFRIGQVIRNLLVNAIEFSPRDKTIQIMVNNTSCDISGCYTPCLQVSIKDQGVGIPEDELEIIFEKFTQSSLTKTGAGGTGLGLAICREIIEAHKGKLWAVNNKDVGATFSFCIPIAATRGPSEDS